MGSESGSAGAFLAKATKKWRWGTSYTVTEYKFDTMVMRVLEGLGSDGRSQVTVNIGEVTEMFQALREGNSWIENAAFEARICLVTTGPVGSQFLILHHPNGGADEAVVLVDREEPNKRAAATHEVGHAIFHAYRFSSPKKTPDAAVDITLAFDKLGTTKSVQEIPANPKSKGTQNQNAPVMHPAGLWPADPTQWASTPRRPEHPRDDSDEFFASAREAFLLSRAGLDSAVKRYAKQDSSISNIWSDLFSLLTNLKKEVPTTKPNKPTAADKAAIDQAKREIAAMKEPVELLTSRLRSKLLDFAADPPDFMIRYPETEEVPLTK